MAMMIMQVVGIVGGGNAGGGGGGGIAVGAVRGSDFVGGDNFDVISSACRCL